MKNNSTKHASSNEVAEKEQANSTRILRIVALIAIGSMVSGLVFGLLQTAPMSFPGPPTLTINQITQTAYTKTGLVLMSSGIILFALLPSLRVLLGINQFIHKHEMVNAIVAMIVLLELSASILLNFCTKGVLT